MLRLHQATGIAGVLAILLSSAGCLFEPDDEDATPQRRGGAVAHISIDSLYFWIPVDPIDTTWVWNQAEEGTWEHFWTIDVPVDDFDATFHFSFVRISEGGAEVHGTFESMAAGAAAYAWSTDNKTGLWIRAPIPFGELDVHANGVTIYPWQSIAETVYSTIEPPADFPPPLDLERRSTGRDRQNESVRVDYRLDASQLEARRIRGTLSADEYAIYQVIFSHYMREWGEPFFVESPSIGGEPFDEESFQNIFVLGAYTETEQAFLSAGAEKVDLAPMGDIGYTVVDANQSPHEPGNYVTASRVGFGRKRTEAMVYVVFDCGMLCAEGVVFRLEKINGYWIAKNSVLIWIS
jgi:hypothetical protein